MKRALLFFCFAMVPFGLAAQSEPTEEQPKTWELGGYLKYLPSVNYQEVDGNWLSDNFFHWRLNFAWYPTEQLTVTVENRSRFFYGETVKSFPQYPELIDQETGWANLGTVLLEEQSFFLHTAIDRAHLDYSSGNWQIRAGRQRINWGQSLVWNPNDVFNAYSFFDFDYEERPGTDALLVRYYTGTLSSAEIAIAPQDSLGAYTIAGMFRFNKWNYDFQVLGGKMRDDWLIGTGWSGQLGAAGFKGEWAYFRSHEKFDAQPGQVLGTLSFDYTFPKGLTLQTEWLFNSGGSIRKPGNFDFSEPLSAKTLSLVRHSFFQQASYPLTPLINLSLSGIYSPNDGSYFIGPAANFSVSDNVGIYLVAQSFHGPEGSQFAQAGTFVFGRLKWSF